MVSQAIQVTPDNFRRAETDLYFLKFVRDGGFGKFIHQREPTPIEHQSAARMNRDMLYSSAVFDLEAGSVTLTLPDPRRRFMSLQIWDEDEYCPLVGYHAGPYALTRERIGTRYVAAALRLFVDPKDPEDILRVQGLQDAIAVEQRAHGKFEIPNWDLESQCRVRAALEMLGKTVPDTARTFGARDSVDPVRHLIGAAIAWGGDPEKDTFYVNIVPAKNDGKVVYREHVPADVPVDGLWTVSVYGSDGYFAANPQDSYSVNNVTAAKCPDGSVDVQFGGCDGAQSNCIPITPGWTALVRLYRPRPEILSGKWCFPEPQPVQ
jgi:hypothetical protein